LGASSLLAVESVGLVASSLLLGWGGVDLVRTFLAGRHARELSGTTRSRPRWVVRDLWWLLAIGFLGSALASVAAWKSATGGTLAVGFLIAFLTSVLLETVERAAASAVEDEERRWTVDPSPRPSVAPRFAGVWTCAVALAFLELAVMFEWTGGNVAGLGGLALGAAAAALAVRSLRVPVRRSEAPTLASEPVSGHDASNGFLWSSASVGAAVAIAYYGRDIRQLYAGALLLPVVVGATAALGARLGFALWGTDEGRSRRASEIARMVAIAVPMVFFLYVLDWWLQVGGSWVLGSGTVAVLVLAAVGMISTVGDPARGTGDARSTREERRIAGFAIVASAVALGILFLAGGFQFRWQTFFVPDLGTYCLGLAAVVLAGGWAVVGSAANPTSGGDESRVEVGPASLAVELAAYSATLLTVWGALLLAVPTANLTAEATFLTWLSIANPSYVVGALVGAMLAVVSRIPLGRAAARLGNRASLSSFGLGGAGTILVGVALGPSAAWGTLSFFAATGAIAFYASRSPRPLGTVGAAGPVEPIRGWVPWPDTFPVELLLASLAMITFSGLFFQHGLVVAP